MTIFCFDYIAKSSRQKSLPYHTSTYKMHTETLILLSRSRVGAAENSLLGSSDLSTIIGPAKGGGGMMGGYGGGEGGQPMYSNHRTVSSSDRTLMNAFRTISNMCDRINLPKTISDR